VELKGGKMSIWLLVLTGSLRRGLKQFWGGGGEKIKFPRRSYVAFRESPTKFTPDNTNIGLFLEIPGF